MADEPEVVISSSDPPPSAAPKGADGIETGGESKAPASPAPDWSSQPLPAGLAEKYPGTKTLGEFESRYSSSSGEARRIQEELQAARETERSYRQTLPRLLEEIRKYRSVQAPAQPGRSGYYGYADKVAFHQSFQSKYADDPVNAIAWANNLRMEHDAGFRKEYHDKHIAPALKEQLEPLQQENERNREETTRRKLEATANEFWSRNPEIAAKDNPINQAMTTAAEKAGWFKNAQSVSHAVSALSYAFPETNPFDVLHAVAALPLLKQQQNAQDANLSALKGKAATVRPGAGGKAVPKEETWDDTAKRLAMELQLTEADAEALIALGPIR